VKSGNITFLLLDKGIFFVEGMKSKIPSTGDILVAFATTPGYKAFEDGKCGIWTNILTKKLVTSFSSIYDILTEVNEELISKLKSAQMGSFQQPELIGRLNSTIYLLKESGECRLPLYSTLLCTNLRMGVCAYIVYLIMSIYCHVKLLQANHQ